MLAIFDMDGTLADSSVVLTNAINYVRAKLGLKPLSQEVILEQINNPECDLARFFYGLSEITPKHEEWFKEYYSANHDRELVLFNGIKEMLDILKNDGIKLAVATNAYRSSTIEALKHLNIYNYFDAIICYDDVKEGKPAPDMLIKLLDYFKEDRKNAIFVGDSQRDYLASKAAKIEFILVDFANKKDNPIDVAKKIKEYFKIKS
jgi:phosphoglycolate phosphatase